MRARAIALAAAVFATVGIAAAPPALAFIECRDLGVSLPGATITAGDQEVVIPAMTDIGICYGAAVTFEDPPEVELREGCGTPCFVIDLQFKTAENFGVSVGYYWTDEDGNLVGDGHGNPYMPLSPPVPICIAVGNPRPTC
jgi:hypothetical protein